MSEVKGLGYKITKIDINSADKYWACIGDKTLMPSFLSCKGVGAAAIDENLLRCHQPRLRTRGSSGHAPG